MDYIEALRIQDRLRELGYITSVLRYGPEDARWYVLAGDQRAPKYRLYTARAAAILLMAIRRKGWRGYGQSA